MKSKNRLNKLIALLVLLAMIAMIFVANTYSKYATNASGSDSVVVANWSFKVNDEEIAVTGDAKTIEFGLFDTIYDSDGENEETDVAEGFIAPGTSGAFEFALQNTSEVTAQYGIDFEVTNENDIPIEYSVDGSLWDKNLSNIDFSNNTVLEMGSNTKTIKVEWRWPFESESSSDTVIGRAVTEAATEDEIPNISVKVTIKAKQLDELEIDKLAKNYELSYYATAQDAITAINNEEYQESQNATKYTANVAVYKDENAATNFVLVNDVTVDNEIVTDKDLILNLNGKTLESTDTVAVAVNSGNLTIDGQVEGSRILTENSGLNTTTVSVNAGTCVINGGTYAANSSGVGTKTVANPNILVADTASLTINDATVISNDSNGGTCAAIEVKSGGTATVTNSKITSTSRDAYGVDGIRNAGTMTITNSTVAGISDYKANAAKNDYAACSRAITNEGTMTLKNCNITGTHSGIRCLGTLYIDGGTYGGYGHGGIYFAGSATSYVKNATLKMCDMPEGYIDDGIAGTNKAGMYIGNASNVTVYMDNCTLEGPNYPAVLRSSGGESNNALYLSNSTAQGYSKYFRNDASTTKNNKIYIGVGNNFDIVDTYKEENTVETEEDYSTVFPEY